MCSEYYLCICWCVQNSFPGRGLCFSPLTGNDSGITQHIRAHAIIGNLQFILPSLPNFSHVWTFGKYPPSLPQKLVFCFRQMILKCVDMEEA